MVALPQTYNTADLPDTGGNTVLIPKADYKAVIVASELKQTKDNQGQFLELKVILTEGEQANTEFTERLNIVNNNPVAVKIAYQTLARISESIGMTQTPGDSNQLHNKPLMVRVDTETGKPWTDNDGIQREGKDKSFIKKYLPLPTVGVESNASASPSPFGGNAAAPTAAPAKAPF